MLPPADRVPLPPANASRPLPDLPPVLPPCASRPPTGTPYECGGSGGWCQFSEGEGRMHASVEIGPEDFIVQLGGINSQFYNYVYFILCF